MTFVKGAPAAEFLQRNRRPAQAGQRVPAWLPGDAGDCRCGDTLGLRQGRRHCALGPGERDVFAQIYRAHKRRPESKLSPPV